MTLEEINFPNHLKKIGRNCFAYCSSLTKVTVPTSIRTIGNYCFWNCRSLQEILLPSHFYKSDKLKKIGYSGKIICYDLKEE